jgi:preprotein translocase subunit SecE
MPQAIKQAGQVTRPRNRIAGFISDTLAEMKKVTWLSRREMAYLTGLVLIVAISAGIVLGLIDFGFSELISRVFLGG